MSCGYSWREWDKKFHDKTKPHEAAKEGEKYDFDIENKQHSQAAASTVVPSNVLLDWVKHKTISK